MSPAYRYESENNPAAMSIGALLLRRGDIAAQRARQVGEAQARAAEQRGDIWGRTVSNIGQQIGAIPGQIQQQKRQALSDEVDQMKVAEMRREEKSRAIFESGLKMRQHYNPDGSLNDQAVGAFFRKMDPAGAWQSWNAISAKAQKDALDVRKTVAEIGAMDATAAEKQRAWDTTRATEIGKRAMDAIEAIAEHPDDRMGARDTFLSSVGWSVGHGLITEQEAKQVVTQTAGAGPDQLVRVLNSFIPPEVRQKAEAAQATVAKTQADTATAQATAAKTAAETANLQRYGRPTAPEPSASYKEWQDYKKEGGPLDFNAYQNMDANRKRPLSVTNQATDDAMVDAAARNIVANPRDLTSIRTITSLRGDQRLKLYNRIKQLKPEFNVGNIDRQIKFLDSYEDPKGRAALNRQSMNNILMHSADLSEVNQEYRRANARIVNLPLNAIARQSSDAYVRYQTTMDVLREEIGLYFAGGYAPDKAQSDAWAKIISGDATPNQVEAFAKTIIHVGLRRASTHNSDFKSMMGYDDPNMLIPDAVAAGKKLGLGEEVKKFGSGGQFGTVPKAAPQKANPFR